MFGAFTKGTTTNKGALPQIQDLVIAYETPADLSLNSTPAVERLNNSAPNFLGQFNMTDAGTPGGYASNSSGQSEMFGVTTRPYWEMSNSANGYYTMSGTSISGGTPSGFTVFTISRTTVPNSDYCWQLTPAGSGDTIKFISTTWNDAGTPRPRFSFSTTSGTTITKNENGWSNGYDFRRYHCFATDFSGGATGAEYQMTSGLKPVSGASMDYTTTATAPSNPDSSYKFNLGSVFNRPRVGFQVIYVWRRKLTSAEITQVVDYVNDLYLPTL